MNVSLVKDRADQEIQVAHWQYLEDRGIGTMYIWEKEVLAHVSECLCLARRMGGHLEGRDSGLVMELKESEVSCMSSA